MAHTFDSSKTQILDAVVKQLKHKMGDASAPLCVEFFRQFFGTVSLDDLKAWSVDDLCGAAFNFWTLIKNRKPRETKIRIYNPTLERDGWQTTHTVIELICDDSPFLVDSMRLTINRMGLFSHLNIHMGGIRLTRNAQHEVVAIHPRQGEIGPDVLIEAPIFLEIDRQTDPAVLSQLQEKLEHVLADNRAVVDDWHAMREGIQSSIEEISHLPSLLDTAEIEETKLFLKWIEDHHFTFLGMRDHQIIHEKNKLVLKAVPGTGLGVLRDGLNKSTTLTLSSMTPEARELSLSSRVLIMSKTNTLATVHRDSYTDYIGIKRFDKKGNVIGERRIIGLYTSAAYNTNPKHIPFLRHKVALVLQNSLLNPRSHAGKVLLNILETFPRDDLIQASEDELLDISMGIFHMQERRRIRLFTRMDIYRRFVSCLVYVPKERFNTELRHAMEDIFKSFFHATDITFTTYFSESVLARIHFIVRLEPNDNRVYDVNVLEDKLIEVGRSWADDLLCSLLDQTDEEQANRLYAQYKSAFPAVYMTNFTPRTAVFDIEQLERLSDTDTLGIDFYRPIGDLAQGYHLKLYQKGMTIALSDVLPIIENLGLRAISERPYGLLCNDGCAAWINEFSLHYTRTIDFHLDEMKARFQAAFLAIWRGAAENDGFNQLVLAAGLDWQQVAMLRTYAKYFKQIGVSFSQEYIEIALINNCNITKKIVQLFDVRFNPALIKHRETKCQTLANEILSDLDNVSNLDEDKIIRQYLHAITATLRTNFYQKSKQGQPKQAICIKLSSSSVPLMPRPYPMFEIFVYSPQFEGVHLRCSKVARGGLRWSDRKEDFRTEILGLMKAQNVKNAVIVPSGAKGGFVAKQLPLMGSREDILAEGIACYKQFISSLLDVTDNYKNANIVKPEAVVCYDEDDPYLVVAADKGTATFSDIANGISAEYDFWLGDAFASGGSVGYDHKKMGITARGAWESVKRHFYDSGVDIDVTDFTVVGIGDMAGDVFGNGMLLSSHIKLVAAFNHMHIFIDPNPTPLVSLAERTRLFNLPRSSWADYDAKLISKGGGVFNRNAKSITVSKEMKQLFDIKQAAIEPNELIKLILQAKVDLLWSGGIGTFVKAKSEANLDVGDRTNDAIRINGSQLKCRIVAEGGNLGLTQLGRVEYALSGGLLYTDFIDNSAGVSCSDKEVNIKILLDKIVAAGELTYKQRNTLLTSMTDEVASLVLNENYLQTRAISLLVVGAMRSLELHNRYLNALEHAGKLDRELESIPDEKTLMERKLVGKGLTSPEISVLLCQSKINLKEDILASDVPEDPYLRSYLLSSFPKPLQKRFSVQIDAHPLRREIIATRVSNIIINEMGFSFLYRLHDETGAPVSAIVKAYLISRAVLHMESIWSKIDALHGDVAAELQNDMMMTCVRLLRRTTRWFLRSKRSRLDMTKMIKHYEPGVIALKRSMPSIFGDGNSAQYNQHIEEYRALSIPDALAHELTATRALFSAMDIIDVAYQEGLDIPTVAEVYFGIGEFLDLTWIRSHIIVHSTENHWEALSREALRDDLDWQQRQLTAGIIRFDADKNEIMACFYAWSTSHAGLIERWQQVLANLRSSTVLNYTMFFVAIRELLDLTQTTMQIAED